MHGRLSATSTGGRKDVIDRVEQYLKKKLPDLNNDLSQHCKWNE